MLATMDRGELILAALCSGGQNAIFTPVQVQKLFFLVDRELGSRVGGPHFAFQPYDYGPFDGAVYRELESLASGGLVQIDTSGSIKRYALTPLGFQRGEQIASAVAPGVRDYLQRVATWVRSLGFAALVSAIYQKYPDMRVNSIFK
jgi:uncharacterized protein